MLKQLNKGEKVTINFEEFLTLMSKKIENNVTFDKIINDVSSPNLTGISYVE